MFLVSLVTVSIVSVIKIIDTASIVILSFYASVCLYPLTLSAMKLKLTSFLSSRSIWLLVVNKV
jgi:hypothetical protein